MKHSIRIWALVACLAWGFFLGGCVLPQSAKPVVKIGLVAPFEGRYRSLGYETLYAVRWAVRERNEAGGVSGYLVELAALDDGDDPAVSAFQAREFAADPAIMGVVGPFSYGAVVSAAPVYHDLRLAMITPATCSPSLSLASYGEVFCLGADGRALELALIERLPGGARAKMLRVRDGTLGDGLALPLEQVEIGPLSEGASLDLSQRPVDVYLYDGDVLSAADLLNAMRAVGIDAPLWGGPSLARTQLPQIAGQAAAGSCYAITAPHRADLTPGSPFVRGYQDVGGGTPGPWAALAYDAAALLLDALEREIAATRRPSREGVIARLADSPGPGGVPVFVDGRRLQVEIAFYCYGQDDEYPGRIQ